MEECEQGQVCDNTSSVPVVVTTTLTSVVRSCGTLGKRAKSLVGAQSVPDRREGNGTTHAGRGSGHGKGLGRCQNVESFAGARQVQILTPRTSVHTLRFNGIHQHNLVGQDDRGALVVHHIVVVKTAHTTFEENLGILLGADGLNEVLNGVLGR